MAEVGRLRLRDDRLVVEGLFDGRIIAEIEPDPRMVIDRSGILAAQFMQPMVDPFDLEARLSVSWWQRVKEEPGHIDGEAEEIEGPAPPRPELEAGDDA
jgi:hypothetical protein